MYAHDLAHSRNPAHRSAQAIADMPACCRPGGGVDDDTELRARSTPFFRSALAHLILAAAQVQRAGGVQHIALRRHAKPSPHVVFTAKLDGRELAFATHVGNDGQAHVVHGADRAAVHRHELGDFESPQALVLHRRAVSEFLATLRPTLTLDASAAVVADDPDHAAGGPHDLGVNAMFGRDRHGYLARRSYDAAFAAFGMLPQG
jgi:hypothetical protein